MPAISCHSCRRLISDQEDRCPFCQAPQRVERTSQRLSASAFRDPNAVIGWIVGVNVLMYAAAIFLNPDDALSFEQGILGFGAPDGKALYLLGMTGGPSWICGHYWTLFTASFLHGSLLHIFFNLSWLRQLGSLTVHLLGPARFLIIYFITGAGGFLLSNFWSNSPTIGASCSIFGLLGVLLAFSQRRGGVLGVNLNRQIWAWTIIGLALGFVIPMINNAGHIGGLITGYVLGYILPKQEGTRESGLLQVTSLLLLGLTVLAFGYNGWVMSDIFKQLNSMGQFFCR